MNIHTVVEHRAAPCIFFSVSAMSNIPRSNLISIRSKCEREKKRIFLSQRDEVVLG